MALSEDGSVVGSVSGGCIEDDLASEYTKACRQATGTNAPHKILPHTSVQRIIYGIGADEAHRFGLPCGGTLELLLEFNPEISTLQALIEQMEAGELVGRATDLKSGHVTLHKLDSPKSVTVSDDLLFNTFGPAFRMLVIGAGQLSEYLCTMALFCGFSVTVCDPRETYVKAWTVPNVKMTRDMPDDAVKSFRADRHSCIVATTHDPKLDDMALLEALESDAFYVGAIGSRKNQSMRRERMHEHFGLGQALLNRLHGPAGLSIGSKTPAEIAISIMAEVLAVKNGPGGHEPRLDSVKLIDGLSCGSR